MKFPPLVAAVVAAFLGLSAAASATPVTLSDFSSGITPHGAWTWSSNAKIISFGSSNKTTDWIAQTFAAPKALPGATEILLTGEFYQSIGDGNFAVELFNAAAVIGRSSYVWTQFKGGAHTVASPIVWSGTNRSVTGFHLVGSGSSTFVRGSYAPSLMTTNITVPEPTTLAMAVAALAVSAFYARRVRKPLLAVALTAGLPAAASADAPTADAIREVAAVTLTVRWRPVGPQPMPIRDLHEEEKAAAPEIAPKPTTFVVGGPRVAVYPRPSR